MNSIETKTLMDTILRWNIKVLLLLQKRKNHRQAQKIRRKKQTLTFN